jgi:DNA-binding NtrC family response regulator
LSQDSRRILSVESARALDQMSESEFDVAVIVAPLPDCTVEDLLEQLVPTGIPVIVRDPGMTISDAVRYMRLGAYDVAGLGADLTELIESACDVRGGSRRAEDEGEAWRGLLVGSSHAMRRTAEVIALVGGRKSTVLITGETGTGKELVARAIHLASPRAHLPMVPINCAALPENLLEAELFGHVKGAFTGAVQHRIGRFEQAHRSTLFLDEIGDLPLDTQTKLLRVLQEREFQRLGSSETVRVDVRLIAATNTDLPQRIRDGRFREDLFYRLNVVPISTPPLRERLDDVALLANHFAEKICRQEEIPTRRLSPETLARLRAYSWPGNVRQLENSIESAIALSGERQLLSPSDFALGEPAKSLSTAPGSISLPAVGLDFDQTVGGIERQILEEAMRKAGGNKTAAAEMLRLKRTTLAAKLKSLRANAS